MRICVFDLSNILYRSFYANRGESSDDLLTAGLAHASGLTSMNKWFNQFKPDRIYACFDRPSWRKQYTKSEECVSKRLYKGHRRQTMTPAEKKKYEQFIQHVAEFEDILRNYTTIHVLAGDLLEADDLMAAVVQECSSNVQNDNELLRFDDNNLNEIIIISSDKDLIQLLKYPNVKLIDPASGNPRTLDEWDNDVNWFMFEKCMRGDRGDNVMSALPRVLTTRLKKAYSDEFERVNMMNESWTLATTEQEFKVGEVYNENQLLMDLHFQPSHIKEKMKQCIIEERQRKKTFDYFHFTRFLGKYQLKRISEQLTNFVPMLSAKG